MESSTPMEIVLTDSTNKQSDLKSRRNIEIVDELVEKAKINRDDLAPIVQNIYFTDSIASEEYKLLELDQEKLDYLLQGNSLVIRGSETENAVCCTQTSTYSFKVAEISNPLLVCSNLQFANDLNDLAKDTMDDGESSKRACKGVDVVFMTNSYFLMNKEKPKLHKLKSLLETNLYYGRATDANNDAIKYSIKDLLDTIQASEEEIYKYLNFIEAYQIDGYWRLLDFKFYNEILDNVLKLMDEKSWQPDQIPVQEIYDELEHIYGLSILTQMVNYYFTPSSNDPTLQSINVEKAAHFYAESLLRATYKMRYAEFQLILRKSMPANFNYEFNLNQIQDLCYVEEPFIYYLNVLDLPDDIEKRFKYLFEKRKKWNFDELKSLIQDLCSFDLIEINNALTKYCRLHMQNNIKYYTTRM